MLSRRKLIFELSYGVAALTAGCQSSIPATSTEPAAALVDRIHDSPARYTYTPDTEIQRILSERIDGQKRSVGIAVGIVDPDGRRVVAHGHLAQGDPRQVDGGTVFDIGSITKVFSALVLADMASRGDVAPSDPVALYLPERVVVPAYDGQAITLEDLATHRSGLPRLPDNLSPKDLSNPYADYTIEQLYTFLSGYRLPRKIGEQHEYSNLGYGLLGHVLTLRTGLSYEALVQDRILAPLDMSNTGIALTPEIEAGLARGHDDKLDVVPNWDMLTLAGAGALRSTTHDLLNFLEMLLGLRAEPLAASAKTALDWVAVKSGEDQEMLWHNGGTGGYRSFIGLLPNEKVGVVVLSNSSVSVDDIGQHLLNATSPLLPQPGK